MGKQITSRSITLRTKNGDWLGQVVLTSDGMFAAVTDYGNLSYAWRAFGDDFEEFLLGLNESYFGQKLYTGLSYITHNRSAEQACYRFAEKILPPLQDFLRSDNF